MQLLGRYLDKDQTEFKYDNVELFEQLYVDGGIDPEIENKLVMNNIRFVHFVINKYFKNLLNYPKCIFTYEDLFSAGTYALVKAIRSFDVSKGNKFVTYMYMVISNEIKQDIRKSRDLLQNVNMEEDVILNHINISKEDFYFDLMCNDAIDTAKKKLTDTEFEVWEFMLRDIPQREVAEKINISQPHVSRLYKKATAKLREEYV